MTDMYALSTRSDQPETSQQNDEQRQERPQEDNASQQQNEQQQSQSGSARSSMKDGTPAKILSTGGLLISILLSLLLGLAFVVRSLKNVKLVLKLKLKRDDRAEKKY